MWYSTNQSNHASFSLAGVLALVAILFSSAGHAAIYTVGGDGACDFGTIAAALTAAEGNFGADTIRLARDTGYAQQAISVTTSQELTITGGFQNCGATEDATYTTLSGQGGIAASVLTINGGTGSLIRLRKLEITGGDVSSGASAGGGINYTGNGLLDIADVNISNNTGAYGGGINALGSDYQAELDIGPNVAISQNEAHYNGGGIYSNNIETVIRSANTFIYANKALAGYGGGIDIRACYDDSIVYLGSPGSSLGLPVVYGNTAKYGGGVAIQGGTDCLSGVTGELRMFSTDAMRPTSIQANQALVSGGGIYLSPSTVPTAAYIWNASIDDNSAPDASAAYLGSAQTNSSLYLNGFNGAPTLPAGAVDCVIGVICGSISGNFDTGTGAGHVIYGGGGNKFFANYIEVSGNEGSELIRLETPDVVNSTIKANTTTARLIEGHNTTLHSVTIAGNTIGGSAVLGINTGGKLDIARSIVWQPFKVTLHNDGSPPSAIDILSTDIVSLNGGSRLIKAEPRFVDAAHDDYSLTAASPAVDYAPANIYGYDGFDMWGLPRNVDLAVVENIHGPIDLGALERQTVAPLANNGDFNANANIWTDQTPGVSSWDSTQNISGPSGSGSLHVNLANASSVVAGSQCIHLPGKGTYALNGWGKSTGTISPGNNVKLVWEYRENGSEACTGTADATGELLLATTGTWRRPSTPVRITTDFYWTTNTSILVKLVVDDGPGNGRPAGPSSGTLVGWFDGITLDLVPGDYIFRNGFED